MAKYEIKEMSALSIIQPWAECIVSKGKNVENRSRISHKRGFIAIHASAAYKKEYFEYCNEDYKFKIGRDDVAYGSIVGFAELVDVITKKEVTKKTKKWFSGEYGYVLANVIKLQTPIKAKGALGFWKLNGKNFNLCLDQLTKAQIKTMKDSISCRSHDLI